MNVVIRGATRSATSKEGALIALEALGTAAEGEGRAGEFNGELSPYPLSIQERFRRLPEAVLLTAGYYASRAPVIGDLLRKRP
jgi:hypothetical protein